MPDPSDSPAAAPAESPALAAARRLVESVVVAVATSTGVYLVGSVYTEAYYGRMSIDANALDLSAPYTALQAVHAVQSLLAYPVLVLLAYGLYRVAAARLPQAWAGRQGDRFGRLALLAVNGLVALPLVLAAASAGSNRALLQTSSALGEVVSLMQAAGFALLVYVLWLSLGPRRFLLAELRQRRLLPLALVVSLYLLGALVNTADRARANAEQLMTGASDTSLAVTFAIAEGEPPLPQPGVILVAMRNGHYFVVERQPYPPSRTPRAYAVPFRAADRVELERVNPAPTASHGIFVTLDRFDDSPAP